MSFAETIKKTDKDRNRRRVLASKS